MERSSTSSFFVRKHSNSEYCVQVPKPDRILWIFVRLRSSGISHELRNEVVEELTTEEVRKTVLGRVLHSSKTPGTEEI